MKKILVLIPLLILTTSCGTKDISESVTKNCKNAIEAAEKFYNFEYSYDQANNELQIILDSCNSNSQTDNDNSACQKISSLLNSIKDYNNGKIQDRNEIDNKRKEVKKECGI